MKAVIMAGGRGTRIAALAGDLPKPMLPIDGRPVLERELGSLREHIFILSAVFVSHPNSRLFLSMVSLVISAGGAGLGAGFIFSSHSLILFLHACSRLLSHFMAALKLLIASLYLPLFMYVSPF